ncbi:hypothetical protein HPP92_008754 [Vanilla planifolia]|uniref:Receptor-like serine/threonine-protein kinase n=1 Tax=Vanilla planifolia TaxID=51239 RepID=A0A835V5P1_VANPL|nr:hypothetical protein HPP92_008754 [Vanilla planifolia]
MAVTSLRHLLLSTITVVSFFPTTIPAVRFGYPTANLSTDWINGPSIAHQASYPDNSMLRSILLRGWAGPSYSFGFFCYVPCTSFLLAISIVYTNSGSDMTLPYAAAPQVIWSANRDRAVHENATLLFSPEGNLILRDFDGTFVWSSNTSGRGAAVLSILESGNLVILDGQNNTLWASFDHPTDSLLPGQTLREGQRLTANTSATNVASGYCYLTISSEGLRAFVDSNPPQLYYTKTFVGSSKNNMRNGTAYMTYKNGSLDMFLLFNQSGFPDAAINLPNFLIAQYMRLELDGRLRIYSWNRGWNVWMDVIPLFPDECSSPTICGRYGICSEGQCSCPRGVNGDTSYFTPVNPTLANLGCNPLIPLSCEFMESHQFVSLDSFSYFNYVDRSTVAIHATDEDSCKQACLRNCSCKAALFQYIENTSLGSCYLPSEIFSLMRNRPEITRYNSSAFIKVQTGPGNALAASPDNRGRSASREKLVIGVVSSFILAGILVAFFFISIQARRRRTKQLEEEDHIDEIPGMPTRFSYHELKEFTQNFKDKLGQGGFGTVFKGQQSDGTKVAVKRLDGVAHGEKQFLAEVRTTAGIHHINLVRLIGFCVEKAHRLLVFEYMANGSLDKWVFGRTKDTSLDWQTRRNIIVGIAKGLLYLHEECQQRIAHLDIKPQNILLDGRFTPKVADFSLSKLMDRDQSEVVTRMRGTPGYLAPEWLTSTITEKVDVYSFGVVVLEIICGRRVSDPSQPEEGIHLISLILEKLKENRLADLFDQNSSDMRLHGEDALEMMRLAIWCLHNDSNRRPSMSMVVEALEGFSDVKMNMDHDLL